MSINPFCVGFCITIECAIDSQVKEASWRASGDRGQLVISSYVCCHDLTDDDHVMIVILVVLIKNRRSGEIGRG